MGEDRTPLFFSVIVPSYNRLDELQDLLLSLEAQSFSKDAFEVVLVDDGSTDGSKEWLESRQTSMDVRLRILKQHHQGPGAARNLGMANASGQFFVFIDSDCMAPPDWLSILFDFLSSDPEIQGFGGRDDARPDFPSLLLAINYAMTSFLTTGGMRGGKKKKLAKFYPRSFNMGIHRDLYAKIDGFGALRHGQDIEFSHRMIRSGAKIVHIFDSVVYHKRRTSLFRFYRQVFNWGVARINLYKLDQGMLEPLHVAPALGFWFMVLFTALAVLIPGIRSLWTGFACVVSLALVLSGVHAAIKWNRLTTGFLTPVVMTLQIFGYAMGFSLALFWRVVLGRGEWTGFVKRYYR